MCCILYGACQGRVRLGENWLIFKKISKKKVTLGIPEPAGFKDTAFSLL